MRTERTEEHHGISDWSTTYILRMCRWPNRSDACESSFVSNDRVSEHSTTDLVTSQINMRPPRSMQKEVSCIWRLCHLVMIQSGFDNSRDWNELFLTPVEEWMRMFDQNLIVVLWSKFILPREKRTLRYLLLDVLTYALSCSRDEMLETKLIALLFLSFVNNHADKWKSATAKSVVATLLASHRSATERYNFSSVNKHLLRVIDLRVCYLTPTAM